MCRELNRQEYLVFGADGQPAEVAPPYVFLAS